MSEWSENQWHETLADYGAERMMLEAKRQKVEKQVTYTPGPWKQLSPTADYIDADGERSPILSIGISSGKTIVAHVNLHEPDATTRDQCRGNARLIAAAPDMAQALFAALTLCNTLGREMATIAYDGKSDFCVTDVIRAAIAKTTREP